MFRNFLRFLKFKLLLAKVAWEFTKFEAKHASKPTKLYLRGDIFDFMYGCILQFEILDGKDFEDFFGVRELSRDNSIKFARYA